MKILVTGAGGFLGSYICEYFALKGHFVLGWDLHASMHKLYEVKHIDLLSIASIKERLIADKPDMIIHCAGSADVGKSVENPDIDYNGNVTITHNLLFSLKECKIFQKTRFIYLSSAAVYGEPKELPIQETAILNPLSPYALHKVMCEDICKYFSNVYKNDIKIIRIFSAYGSGLKKQIFWDMFYKAKNTKCLRMYGTGNETRDYINVKDVAQGIYLISMNAPCDEMFYNLANGEQISIKKVTMLFANNFGIDQSTVEFDGQFHSENPIYWKADISKLLKLGYKKTVNIDEGIAEYVDWTKEI